MISLFINKNTFNYKSRLAPDTQNIYSRIETYLDSVVKYFHRSNYFVNNNNVLCKLVDMLSVAESLDTYDIVSYVRNNSGSLIRPLGLSSEYYIEILSGNNSIIKNAVEMIYINNLTNITNIPKQSEWKNMEPLRFRNHNFRDLYFNHPDRIEINNPTDVIYDLDIVSLMVMYNYYIKDCKINNIESSVERFIGSYVLSNSIRSLADIAIINNYLDKGDIYVKPKQFVSTTSVSINESKLDMNIISKSIIYNDNNSIMELLRNIPLLGKKDAYEFLFLENFYETSRSRLYLAITLLDFIDNIMKFIEVDGRDNGAYIKMLRYDIKVMMGTFLTTSSSLINRRIRDIIDNLRRV